MADDLLIEVWNKSRKVTVYRDSVLRVWGSDMDSEMADEPHTQQALQSAFAWLYAEPTAKSTDDRTEGHTSAVSA